MDEREVEEALLTLGELLAERGHEIGLLVIGGSSLLLLGWIDRATADVDVAALVSSSGYVAADLLPAELVDAATDVGRALGLGAQWLNAGPAGLLHLGLMDGFAERVEVRRYAGLEVHLPGRIDLIGFKLFAAADLHPANAKHIQDLRALDVSGDELRRASVWVQDHDDSPGFAELLRLTIAQLGGVGR